MRSRGRGCEAREGGCRGSGLLVGGIGGLLGAAVEG